MRSNISGYASVTDCGGCKRQVFNSSCYITSLVDPNSLNSEVHMSMSYLPFAHRFASLAAQTVKRMLGNTLHRNTEPSISETTRSFLQRIRYIPPQTNESRRKELVSALQETLLSWRVLPAANSSSIYSICQHSAAMAELSYPHHDFDTQLQIAKFTWFLIYVDDLSSNMPSALEDFQLKLLRHEAPEDPVLQHFTGHLMDMYRFWDRLPANCITSAALEFITGCALEIHTEIRKIELALSSTSWPYFLRARTGVAPAYAVMIFRTLSGNMSRYMQVIADVCLFIDLTNDVLSFHKEEVAGETRNYIHNRAGVSRKLPTNVLAEVAEEAVAAQNRVTAALRACRSEGIHAWETFVQGYVAFHLTQDRYRLNELLS
ncbi:isoprenoid synthase domain-containing protein [Mycena metata]|uniref:Isoprenoid synthase domain-containing protein n=1 Tax=Mycena metata TaxID=1033252 RepID=A0AAD7J927_9AGAR|nr:isoprenoid synthase domain-containing protein [Mycena metata]